MSKFYRFNESDRKEGSVARGDEMGAFRESVSQNQRPWMIVDGEVYSQKPEIAGLYQFGLYKDLVVIDRNNFNEIKATISKIRLKKFEFEFEKGQGFEEVQGYAIGIINDEIETAPISINDLYKSLEIDGVHDIFNPFNCEIGCCGTTVETKLIGEKYVKWNIAYYRETYPEYFIHANFQDKLALLHLPLYFSTNQIKEELKKIGQQKKKE